MPKAPYQKMTQATGRGFEKFVGELEGAVLEVLWRDGAATVREVVAQLATDQRVLAYTTVLTILSRLADKGWVVAQKEGRHFRYTATYSRVDAERVVVTQVVRALLSEFGEVAVAQFVKEMEAVDPDQLARLAALSQAEPDEE